MLMKFGIGLNKSVPGGCEQADRDNPARWED
jgi:hypothetical protein